MSTPPAQPDPAVIAVLAALVEAGVRLAPAGANVRYWSPVPLAPELRELIVKHKPAILTALSVWCIKRVDLLREQTDALVEALGVNGFDPEIVAAATRWTAARDARDMAGVRLACLDIEVRARSLAAERGAK